MALFSSTIPMALAGPQAIVEAAPRPTRRRILAGGLAMIAATTIAFAELRKAIAALSNEIR